jgi:hypothetical protein
MWFSLPGPDRLVPDLLLVLLLEGLRRVPEGTLPPPLVRVVSLSDAMHGGPQALYGDSTGQAILVRHLQSYLVIHVDERLPSPPPPLPLVRQLSYRHIHVGVRS